MNYAWIENAEVTNLLWLSPANAHEFPNAVPLGDRPVSIGDTYADGKFYRDGAEILTPLEAAQAELEDMQTALELLGVDPEGVSSDG